MQPSRIPSVHLQSAMCLLTSSISFEFFLAKFPINCIISLPTKVNNKPTKTFQFPIKMEILYFINFILILIHTKDVHTLNIDSPYSLAGIRSCFTHIFQMQRNGIFHNHLLNEIITQNTEIPSWSVQQSGDVSGILSAFSAHTTNLRFTMEPCFTLFIVSNLPDPKIFLENLYNIIQPSYLTYRPETSYILIDPWTNPINRFLLLKSFPFSHDYQASWFLWRVRSSKKYLLCLFCEETFIPVQHFGRDDVNFGQLWGTSDSTIFIFDAAHKQDHGIHKIKPHHIHSFYRTKKSIFQKLS